MEDAHLVEDEATRPEPLTHRPRKEVAGNLETPPGTVYHLTEEALQELLSATVRDALSRARTTRGTSPIQPRRLSTILLRSKQPHEGSSRCRRNCTKRGKTPTSRECIIRSPSRS
ncbi:hypothetical protein Salat_2774800 [Sesamum alatum]|uniref:Uncharacterized protein n=1 Tax=Sesamum alatum TaxID=300844 RepID=A0AAE1XKI3_9LAMI|nr:hypothetical protein Salat_2774800 [Sesamum alatum]